MNKTFTALFSQHMTRREFLTKIGLFLVTLTGINAIMRSLSPTSNKQEQQSGFGSGPYGK